jgi:hypothetical protein
MSRVELRLVSAHPDRAAGLRFLAHSLRAFSVLALAVAALVSGAIANRIVYFATSPEAYVSVILGLAVCVLAFFAGPLALFTGQLLREKARGTFEYGALALETGHLFERKWLYRRGLDRRVLAAPDFSATTDLYQVVANVHGMRSIPIDLTNLAWLMTATLLPFLPLAMLALQFRELLLVLAKALL